MTPLKLSGFSGVAPMLSATKLPPNMAQIADNCRLFSGDLSSWKRPGDLEAATKAALGEVKSIFRIDNNGAFWLNWLTDVNCVRGPIAGDISQRIYFTGDGEPRISNAALATSGGDFPTQFFVLGVFAPTVKPTVGHTGGAGANVTRSFVYTYVTAFGEESQPSPPELHTAPVDATSWDVTAMQVAPLNTFAVTAGSWSAGVATLTVASTFGLRVGEEAGITGNTPAGYDVAKTPITALTATTISYALAVNPGAWSAGGAVTRTAPHNTASMKKRIYVTGDTGTGETDFQFWVEVDVATTAHSAAITDTALSEVISSTGYAMPPVDMLGIIEFENGVLVGFAKNEVCPCEPYKPHAWPTAYRQPTSRDIVGIGAFSKTLVIGTKAQPYVLAGTHPENYSFERINHKEPCLSKRGIASFPFGVIYPSPNGLMLVGVGGATLVTEGILSKREWDLFNQETLNAQEYQGRYFAWYDSGGGIIKGFVFDKSGRGPNLVTFSVPATAIFTDPETGELYIVDEGLIKLWDGDTLNNLPYDWFSKIVVLPKPINLGYAKIEAKYEELDDDDEVAAQKAMDTAINAVILAGSEAYPGQSKTKGEFMGSMWGQQMWNGSLLIGGDYPNYDNRTLVFQLYARNPDSNEMELRHVEFPISNKVFSLPGGYEETDYAVRLSGNIDTVSVEIAETAEELAQV